MILNLKRITIVFVILILSYKGTFASFTDVIPQSLFFDAVNYFSYEYPIIGLDKDNFRPLSKINKAEFFKLLIESGNTNSPADSVDSPYKDINGDEWFAKYINTALKLNLIHFDPDDPYFRPGNTINRADGLKYILSYYGIDPDIIGSFSKDYTDISQNDYFADESQVAYMLKLLSDYKLKRFNPYKELTRAQTVYILYKLHQSGFTNSTMTKSNPVEIREKESYKLFLDVYDTILDEYVDKEKIDENSLIYGAISGMVTSLNDPYSTFMPPQDAQGFRESLSGAFDGIGVYLSYKDGNYIIQTPLKGSPAEKVGLKPNDIIIDIDGQNTTDMTFDNITNMLKGPSGSKVVLTIKRNSVLKKYTLTRSLIDIPFVEGEIINGVGVIHYYQFTSNSNYQFTNKLNTILNKNPKGLVIDLRNNPGGYVYSAQQFISRFLAESEPFVTVNLADNYSYNEVSYGPGDLSKYKIVVLINGGSASASEIVALALKENLGAKIVGTQSFGKGKIQEVISYKDGSSLKLSMAQWTSPNGISVEDGGIIPDIEITGESNQLNKAISLATH
ncbi:S-layer homology domain-containing protein [bacterium]|nr:S-layer homology domain-containing protein [bacterium]